VDAVDPRASADRKNNIVNAERRGKRQVLIRPSSKVVVKTLSVMQKHGKSMFQHMRHLNTDSSGVGKELGSHAERRKAMKEEGFRLGDQPGIQEDAPITPPPGV